MDINFEKLLTLCNRYLNKSDLELISKVFYFASQKHEGQLRESGEAYIIHPLNVAYFLVNRHADVNTICAALLHDVVEDTKTSLEEIEILFNRDIRNLVDGVTKIKADLTKQESTTKYLRKILTSLNVDVRIVLIKLSDMLHNMSTLEYKKLNKQTEKSLLCMEIFVPLANSLGDYETRTLLEDYSLKFLKPDAYEKISEELKEYKILFNPIINEFKDNINYVLDDNGVVHNTIIRNRNIYGIYKRLNQGYQLNEIHDLIGLKILVESIKDCYLSLMCVNTTYRTHDIYSRDYISRPKTNMYKALHTTVFGPSEKLIQVQIKTTDMDFVDTMGLSSYWKYSTSFDNSMQERTVSDLHFLKTLENLDKLISDDNEFIEGVKKEVFNQMIYVYDSDGEVISLPEGSTPIDFAYAKGVEFGNKMIDVLVNGKYCSFEYQLKNQDKVKIIIDENLKYPNKYLFDYANNEITRQLILNSKE